MAIKMVVIWLIRIIVVVEGKSEQLLQLMRGKQPLCGSKRVGASSSSPTTTTTPHAVSLLWLPAEHV
jgi:hypothetical protein